MPHFTYKAKDKSGSPVEGSMDAENRAAVTSRLQAMGYFPIKIDQKGASGSRQPGATKTTTSKKLDAGPSKLMPKLSGLMGGGGSATKEATPAPSRVSMSKTAVPKMGGSLSKAAVPKLGGTVALGGGSLSGTTRKLSATDLKKQDAGKAPAKAPTKSKPAADKGGATAGFDLAALLSGKKPIKSAELASFNRQMADLLGAGVPLVKALTIMGKQAGSESLSEVVNTINADVQDGATFADALAKHPKVFSKLYVAMVRSGEAGGMLDEVLKRLADFSEQEEQLKGKVKSALAYPMVMIIAGSGAVLVLFTYVVPKIVGVFDQLNQTLPVMTQLLITISDFLAGYWYIAIGAVMLMTAGFLKYISTPDGELRWHTFQLKIPIFGDLVAKREVARFSRTLGSLLKNGVSILQALNITRDVLNNVIAKNEVDSVIEEITQGESIAVPLKNSRIFPPVTINMMAVGEETGQLENVLLRISDSYEMEVERRIRTLTSLIEPLIIVAMAFVVGFIVIAMLLPIFSLDPSGAA